MDTCFRIGAFFIGSEIPGALDGPESDSESTHLGNREEQGAIHCVGDLCFQWPIMDEIFTEIEQYVLAQTKHGVDVEFENDV